MSRPGASHRRTRQRHLKTWKILTRLRSARNCVTVPPAFGRSRNLAAASLSRRRDKDGVGDAAVPSGSGGRDVWIERTLDPRPPRLGLGDGDGWDGGCLATTAAAVVYSVTARKLRPEAAPRTP